MTDERAGTEHSAPGGSAAGSTERDRLYVNEERTVFVRVWASGVVEVARRADPAETWGPPVYLKEERWPSR